MELYLDINLKYIQYFELTLTYSPLQRGDVPLYQESAVGRVTLTQHKRKRLQDDI